MKTIIRPSQKIIFLNMILSVVIFGLFYLLFVRYWTDKFDIFWIGVAGLFLTSFYWTLKAIKNYLTTSLAIEELQISFKSAFLNSEEKTLQVQNIADISVLASVFQRILKIGDIRFTVIGEASPLVLHGLDSPAKIKDFILNLKTNK